MPYPVSIFRICLRWERENALHTSILLAPTKVDALHSFGFELVGKEFLTDLLLFKFCTRVNTLQCFDYFIVWGNTWIYAYQTEAGVD